MPDLRSISNKPPRRQMSPMQVGHSWPTAKNVGHKCPTYAPFPTNRYGDWRDIWATAGFAALLLLAYISGSPQRMLTANCMTLKAACAPGANTHWRGSVFGAAGHEDGAVHGAIHNATYQRHAEAGRDCRGVGHVVFSVDMPRLARRWVPGFALPTIPPVRTGE